MNEEILDFYVIIVYSDAESDLQLIEGVSISTEDEPKVIKFLLEERPGLEKLPHPFSIDDMQMYIGEQVPHLLYSKGIKSMAQLMQLIKCRRYVKVFTCNSFFGTVVEQGQGWKFHTLLLHTSHILL